VRTIYQQLHNYPVGTSGEARAPTTFGNKYNITPVRRELLVHLRAILVLDGNADVEEGVRHGLSGGSPGARYGLPFLGDNAFLPDRIQTLQAIPKANWYERVSEEQATIRPRTTRLTIWIDRADTSRTKSQLYAPSELTNVVPQAAWTDIIPPV
jgi:CRISPR-associated protein Cas5t